MDINSINSIFSLAQSSFSKKTVNSETQGTDQNTPEKTAETVIESTIIQRTTKYDFEHITPKETYEIANKLYNDGEISFLDFAGLMAIGFSHQYSAPYSDLDEPNNAPYNLFDELEAIASGTHEKFTNITAKDQEEAKDLLHILKALHREVDRTQIVSIDIKA